MRDGGFQFKRQQSKEERAQTWGFGHSWGRRCRPRPGCCLLHPTWAVVPARLTTKPPGSSGTGVPVTAQSCPMAEAPLAFQQARGDRCRHQLALLCVWKGLSIVGRWSVGHCSASRTVPAAGTCWFPASASPFSCPPSEAGLGVSSSFSRMDGAEQVSKPAHLHCAHHEGGTGKQSRHPLLCPSHAIAHCSQSP